MDNKHSEIIKEFYEKLKNILLEDNSLKGSSIFISLLSYNSNKRTELLIDSAFSSVHFDLDELNYLKNHKYLQLIEGGYEPDKYILTANAIWESDKKAHNLNENSLIDYFQDKNFCVESGLRELNDKEKRALFTLVSVRCFSRESIMDLGDKKKLANWEKIHKQVDKFLVDNGFISNDPDATKKKGDRIRLEYDMLRVNQLPKKTRQIFRNDGNKKYYLALSEDNLQIDKDKLTFLLNLIIGKQRLTAEQFSNLRSAFKNFAHNESRYVKDDSYFITTEIDDNIYQCLKRCFK